MTEEEQLRVIARGRDAEALRANPVLQEAMKVTLDDLFAQFCATSADDGPTRDAIWAQANALREFNGTVETFINEGKLEHVNREQERKANRSHL